MIPIRDNIPSRSFPVLTYAIIASNVMVFLYEISLGQHDMEIFVRNYGVVPVVLLQSGNPLIWFTVVTSMFLHGGFMHLFGNMLFLYIFGDNVEDVLGRARFIALYFLGGIVAALAQVIISLHSQIPMIGASGAIAAVLAAYIVNFPRARVLTLIPIFFIFQIIEIPAAAFLVIWFVYQLVLGLTQLGTIGAGAGGVAFFAHIFGFLAGLVLALVLRPGSRRRVRFMS